MSGKQAKRLRSAAKGMAVVLDQNGKTIVNRELLAQEHKRFEMPTAAYINGVRVPQGSGTVSVSGTGAVSLDSASSTFVGDQMKEHVYAVTAVNRKDSLRGIIRYLKKGLKKGAVGKV